MTKPIDAAEQFARRFPHPHRPFFNRPGLSRRAFFRAAAAGVTGSFLLPTPGAGQVVQNSGMTTQNSAKKVIFIHLIGAMSHVDTLDLKPSSDTPASFQPSTVNGIAWPAGLLPKLGAHLPDVALVRSVSSWALVHSLAQTWAQIGRNPAAALGDIAPNVGSIIALEKEPERLPGQVFPTFVALNAAAATGQGYLSATYAPFQVTGSAGIPNTTNTSQSTFNAMYAKLAQYDGALRSNAPYGSALSDMAVMYQQARDLMYNSTVTSAFTLNAQDGARYGNGQTTTSFGNACALARQILAADQGARFVQIDFGNWDHHADIYAANNLPSMGAQLDNGLGALLDDLKSSGRLAETLVIVMGEFGRTPKFSAAAGRDHYLIHSVLLAGGGVKGGKVIGATDPTGAAVIDPGWAGSGTTGPRMVRPEDIESTMYSAMGIDWTTVRYDDPFGRGYEYVPFAAKGTYGPIKELFT